MKKIFEIWKCHKFNTLIRKLDSSHDDVFKLSKNFYFQNDQKKLFKVFCQKLFRKYFVDRKKKCRQKIYCKVFSFYRRSRFQNNYFVTKFVDRHVYHQKLCCKHFVDYQKLFRKLVDRHVDFRWRYSRFDVYIKSIDFTTIRKINEKNIMIITRTRLTNETIFNNNYENVINLFLFEQIIMTFFCRQKLKDFC